MPAFDRAAPRGPNGGRSRQSVGTDAVRQRFALDTDKCGVKNSAPNLECGDLSPLSPCRTRPAVYAKLMPAASIPWPHAPEHRLTEAGTYRVTAGTYRKEHGFGRPERLAVLQRGLLKLAVEYGWTLEAWAVFSNHYHFVAQAPAAGASNLSVMLKELHAKSALWINRLDRQPGRKVWHNFWETRLTHQRSYLARLSYVHRNAVRHGLVKVASHYPWCSAGWFEQTASHAQVRTIYGFKVDRVAVSDGFVPADMW